MPRNKAEKASDRHAADSEVSKLKAEGKQLGWGRFASGTWTAAFGCLMILIFCPLMVVYFWTSCEYYGCALSGPAQALMSGEKTISYIIENELPKPTVAGFTVHLVWVAFQYLCAVLVPGPIGYGQRTPAGHILPYKVNGMYVFMLTHFAFFIGAYYLHLFPATIIADNWGSILISANVVGYALTFFAYIKAHLFPSHKDDNKTSGSIIYDIFMGVEQNPRFLGIDFKLFFNGRPGIEAWSLINISFAATQYRDYGYVTNSMLLMLLFELSYIVDFFHNEDWYLRTIDIAHDHFGFYLAWGDNVWLPYMYTLQGFYLSKVPVLLSPWACGFVVAMALGGFFIFRAVNMQKDEFRAADGKLEIWGEPAQYIEATYLTGDGKSRTSKLLTSGWWGLARHFNYVGDLMLSFAYCLCCGFGHLLPYFYIIYMTILLVHRVYRDDSRCRGKYGKTWDEYCRIVRWKILPFVF